MANTIRLYIIQLFAGALALGATIPLKGQKQPEAFSCMNAQLIEVPLGRNDFSDSKVIMADVAVNAVYYLYQDKYSFWYVLRSNQDITLNYAVLPSQREDHYESILYQYQGDEFCKALVEQNVRALSLERTPIEDSGNDEFLYLNTLQMKAGFTYYLSVLSLNDRDCGHKLYLQTKEEELSINAIHRPCYQVRVIDDVVDFSAALDYEPDVDLDLKNIPDTPDAEPEPTKSGNAKNGETRLKIYPLRTVTLEKKSPEKFTYGDRMLLYGVRFYDDTYAFKPGSKPFLKEVIKFMKANPRVAIDVEGYMNEYLEKITPDPKYNGLGDKYNFTGNSKKLSQKRCEVVSKYLTDNGIDPKRITAKGKGAGNPRVEGPKDSSDKGRNERIEILVKKQ